MGLLVGLLVDGWMIGVFLWICFTKSSNVMISFLIHVLASLHIGYIVLFLKSWMRNYVWMSSCFVLLCVFARASCCMVICYISGDEMFIIVLVCMRIYYAYFMHLSVCMMTKMYNLKYCLWSSCSRILELWKLTGRVSLFGTRRMSKCLV